MTTVERLLDLYRRHPRVTTDSRKVAGGELFFALRGPNFDGNAYARTALEKGAAFAVVDDPALRDHPRFLFVPDSLKALQQLAAAYRETWTFPVIGITGSNGKTTTKELMAAVLGRKYRVSSTAGNFNNHIGVPLTLLAVPADCELAVVEMGANHIGEIAFLCGLARPTHGLVTNVGKAHLEGFGSFEGVKKAKGELYEFLAATGGEIFLNEDEAELRTMLPPNAKVIPYHRADSPSCTAPPFEVALLAEQPFLEVGFFDRKLISVHTRLTGRYNFPNLMSAIAVGSHFGVPGAEIQAALEAYEPRLNRSQWVERCSNRFLLDAYNANPTSMAKALEAFAALDAPRKVVILGDMLELGAYSGQEHRRILELALELGFEQVVLVGPQFAEAARATDAVSRFPDASAVRRWLRQTEFQDTYFLLKGSRRLALEKILEEETEPRPEG